MVDSRGAQLSVRGLQAFYADSHVLRGMEFYVNHGEVVALLGRNGAGKTTTIRSIMGMIAKREGSIRFEGHETIGMESDQIARLGVTHCPEDRGIFSSLTVRENLELPPVVKSGGLTLPEIYQLFPRLQERSASAGTKLSGGEQQMLAIARILRTGATLLLLDEPTEGLAPVIVQQIGNIIRSLKDRKLTIVLVEQNLNFAAMLADRHYVVENGSVIDELTSEEVNGRASKLRTYLGV